MPSNDDNRSMAAEAAGSYTNAAGEKVWTAADGTVVRMGSSVTSEFIGFMDKVKTHTSINTHKGLEDTLAKIASSGGVWGSKTYLELDPSIKCGAVIVYVTDAGNANKFDNMKAGSTKVTTSAEVQSISGADLKQKIDVYNVSNENSTRYDGYIVTFTSGFLNSKEGYDKKITSTGSERFFIGAAGKQVAALRDNKRGTFDSYIHQYANYNGGSFLAVWAAKGLVRKFQLVTDITEDGKKVNVAKKKMGAMAGGQTLTLAVGRHYTTDGIGSFANTPKYKITTKDVYLIDSVNSNLYKVWVDGNSIMKAGNEAGKPLVKADPNQPGIGIPDPDGTGTTDDTTGDGEPEYQPEKLTTDLYSDMFSSMEQSDDLAYYHDLYWWAGQEYSAQSFESVVGIPVQFMSNTDMRAGQSRIGRTYSKDILYDAPIACIQAGAPSLNDAGGQEGLGKIIDALVETYSWIGAIKEQGLVQTFKEWLTANLMGQNSRFYGFESQYGRMVHYTNTLCHLFASFLGISDKIIPGTNKRFADYDDTIEEVEKDRGIGLKMVYGSYPAMFVYYQPDSALSQSFTNATQESSLAAKLNEVSNYTKEMSFLAGSLGIASGKGVTVGADVDVGPMFGLADTTFDFGNNLFQRIFARSAEGVGTIVGGNNLMLPEIYNNSNMSGTEYTLNVKLVNPYGSPEGAFLFQMRQLSRLLAISLPRQFGPNGYTAPFIIRAFSKGEFNVQLGIVESLSIKRAGQGGENRTIHGIPMELEVSMVIKDLYQQIAISNEYNDGGPIAQITSLGNLKQLKLLFNNIGLLDFVASYAGYNMNQPSIDMQIDYIQDSLKRNITDMIQFDAATKTWKFPRYHRAIWDSYMNTMNNHATWLAK